MAASLSVIVGKDGAGSTITGGLLAVDKSGAGTGPFFAAHALVDTQGVNTATVKAASTAAVATDTSVVVSLNPNTVPTVTLGSTQNTNLANIDSQTSRLTSSATNVVAGSALATTSFVVGSRYLSTPPTFTNGQEGALQISAAGRLLADANAAQSGTWTVQPGNTANTTPWLAKISDGTNAAAIKAASTAPVATDPALVVAISPNSVNANGQATMANSAPVVQPSDTNGPYSSTANFVSGAITSAMTGTISTSLVAAPGASLRNYITTIIVSNSHATVGTDIIIQDGSGGTTLLTIPAAAVYGGAVITLPTPLKQPNTNTALFCANVTTGASTKVSAVGYKGA